MDTTRKIAYRLLEPTFGPRVDQSVWDDEGTAYEVIERFWRLSSGEQALFALARSIDGIGEVNVKRALASLDMELQARVFVALAELAEYWLGRQKAMLLHPSNGSRWGTA